ncbi:hypothetical protein NMS_2700 [Nonlabens marinus S1-08]|uniref:Uncharacterized protein n=1 Tax=Nonlabens marinus S1-08 TaxID=1454201 RepID=W8VS82_9FLAO|nr:hypothetical protein NMS_2700 [Nonlabens marinus S1-08]
MNDGIDGEFPFLDDVFLVVVFLRAIKLSERAKIGILLRN